MGEKENNNKDGRKSRGLFLLVFFLLSIAIVALGIACLGGIKAGSIQRNFYLLVVAIVFIVALACGLSIWSVLTRREVFAKSMLGVYVLLLFAATICLILQKTGFFEVIQSAESLRLYLEKTGAWMPILYVVLQFLQVIVLPIPSVVSTVAGVALFGAFRAMLYSLIGILLGSFTAFIIGRKLGYRAVVWLVGEDTLKKWQKKLKGKDNLFLTLMFLLPLFPDDVLCLIAGLSTMSTKYFVTVISIARVIGIAATCYSFDFIPFDTWWGISIWAFLLLALVVTFVLIYKNLDKLQTFFKERKRK